MSNIDLRDIVIQWVNESNFDYHIIIYPGSTQPHRNFGIFIHCREDHFTVQIKGPKHNQYLTYDPMDPDCFDDVEKLLGGKSMLSANGIARQIVTKLFSL